MCPDTTAHSSFLLVYKVSAVHRRAKQRAGVLVRTTKHQVPPSAWQSCSSTECHFIPSGRTHSFPEQTTLYRGWMGEKVPGHSHANTSVNPCTRGLRRARLQQHNTPQSCTAALSSKPTHLWFLLPFFTSLGRTGGREAGPKGCGVSSQKLSGTKEWHSSKLLILVKASLQLPASPGQAWLSTHDEYQLYFPGWVISSGEATLTIGCCGPSLGKHPNHKQASHISKGLPAPQVDPPCTSAGPCSPALGVPAALSAETRTTRSTQHRALVSAPYFHC